MERDRKRLLRRKKIKNIIIKVLVFLLVLAIAIISIALGGITK